MTILIKAYFANEDTTTRINLTFEKAKEYYEGNVFNIGSVEDNMQKCTKIELIKIIKVQVKKISEDSGFCREYYKNIDNGNIYARQQEFKNTYKWYTTTSHGEPDCHLRDDLEIEIVGNWEEEQVKEEAKFQKVLEKIRNKVSGGDQQ